MISRRNFARLAGLSCVAAISGFEPAIAMPKHSSKIVNLDWDRVIPDMAKGICSYTDKTIIPIPTHKTPFAGDSVYLPTHHYYMTVEYDNKYIGRKHIEDRFLEVLINRMRHKIESDLVHTMIIAGLERNIFTYVDDLRSNNKDKIIFVSPETVDDHNMTDLYKGSFVFYKNIIPLDDLGENQLYQNYFNQYKGPDFSLKDGYDLGIEIDTKAKDAILMSQPGKPKLGFNTTFEYKDNVRTRKPCHIEGRQQISLSVCMTSAVMDHNAVRLIGVPR